MRRLFFLFLILFSSHVFSQERSLRDEFFRESKQSKNAFKQEWQKSKQEYIEFRRQANLEYIENLKQAWQEYTALRGVPRPKDEEVPPIIYDKEKKQDEKIEEIPIEILPVPTPQPQPEPIAPIIENVKPVKKVNLVFYNTPIAVRVPEKQSVSISHLDNNSLAEAWHLLSSEDYSNLIYDCIEVRDTYVLSDWAYLKFLQALSEKLYGKSNEAILLQAYIYAQSGYSMRLAYGTKGKLYLLVESGYTIYEHSFFDIDHKKFYPLNCEENQLHICEAGFKNEKTMTLQISGVQKLNYKPSDEKIHKGGDGFMARCAINLNDIDFYNQYPTGHIGEDFGTRWATYANVPMDENIRDNLYPQLRQYIAGLSEEEAANKLLNWVQTAFTYGYDDEIWGQDRAFFPSETLYYPYSDCEDHSILFSRIIRDLLGLNVVLLYYPGHLATAVKFNTELNGDYVTINGYKYLVCDPTCLGAPVGRSCADDEVAKVIILNN